MNKAIQFTPRAILDAQANLADFVELVRTRFAPLRECNLFEKNAWSIQGLAAKGSPNKFIYFTQLGVLPKQHYLNGKRDQNSPANVPETLLLREPFLTFSKALLVYMHVWRPTVSLPIRITAFRYLESALFELTGSVCPSATTPEVMNNAFSQAAKVVKECTAYSYGKQLEVIYCYMVKLGLVATPSEWVCPAKSPLNKRNRVGKDFDADRRKKLPSPLALEALAAIFSADSKDPREIFVSSVCALMLCAPDRSVEVLFAPADIFASDWTNPDTGEVGAALRWYPAKGGSPMIKTVIPSMRGIAVHAVDRLLSVSAPARMLARWYEQHPGSLYLPSQLEYLRSRERLSQSEIYAVLFGGVVGKLSNVERIRVRNWLDSLEVPRVSVHGVGTTVAFADLERAVLQKLPEGFPVMDKKTGIRYSEALCLARVGEFDSNTSVASMCCFNRVNYAFLQRGLQSKGTVKSVFEKRGWRDENGEFLYLTTHMLRHYLNTLVRQSGLLTEEEIAKWSGRKKTSQNATYNHLSDHDMVSKLRDAVGDPSKSVGPFGNIDGRTFIRRDEFANIKVISAHTTEFGFCVHDYAQSPCQVHQDCMHCNEQVCIKGDARAEDNLRKMQTELLHLRDEAREAFSDEVLGFAEWFAYQSKSIALVNQLIAILDDPEVPEGVVIQPSGVVPPSRLAMIEESRRLVTKPIARDITSVDELRTLLSGASGSVKEPVNAE